MRSQWAGSISAESRFIRISTSTSARRESSGTSPRSCERYGPGARRPSRSAMPRVPPVWTRWIRFTPTWIGRGTGFPRPRRLRSAFVAEPILVVVPTRDRPAMLAEALASALAQTDPDWVLVAADDGDGEPAEASVPAAVRLDPRVSFVR